MLWRKIINHQTGKLPFVAKNYATTTSNTKNHGTVQRFVIKASTTRGVPSSSIDLKEALCEKIPVYHDLLRKFRSQHGPAVVARITVQDLYEGLTNVCTMVRETSEIDPECGVRYRGLTLPEVTRLLPLAGSSPSAEAVFWLLLTGDVPTQDQASSLIADWATRRQRRKEWWSGNSGGGLVGSVLRALPSSVGPLKRFSIALAALDADKHMKEANRNGAMPHTHWEYAYEDSMELLAVLPAIVGLVAKNEELGNVTEDGDWISFLLECLSDVSKNFDGKRESVGDYLRLYVALNADEDGGVPGAHVSQILGACEAGGNEALAAGVLAYANEPKTGTMSQYTDLQAILQSMLGQNPKEESLINFVGALVEQDTPLVGHRESNLCDPRYVAILDHAKKHLPNHSDVKLSQDITRAFTTIMRRTKGRNISPEQSAIYAPVFQFYGLEDMEFNQVLLCMSRALGAIASIIWARAINMPVERPKSFSTYTYFSAARGTKGQTTHGQYKK